MATERIKSYFKSAEELQTFLDQQNKDNLSVIEISATWSSRCEAIEGRVRQLAEKYTDVIFINVDYDEREDVVNKYRIRYLPTFILVKAGKEVTRVVGARAEELARKINQNK